MTSVDREYGIYDGTVLDYAFLVDGKPRVFVEAKTLGKPLGDPKFVSQTVNYANTEGVTWCVLTDGLRYRAFKANGLSPWSRSCSSRSTSRMPAKAARQTSRRRFSASAMSGSLSGRLAEWAERTFTDVRVRETLKRLIAKPPNGLFAAIETELEAPVPSREQIQKSLISMFSGVPAAPKTAQTSGRHRRSNYQ